MNEEKDDLIDCYKQCPIEKLCFHYFKNTFHEKYGGLNECPMWRDRVNILKEIRESKIKLEAKYIKKNMISILSPIEQLKYRMYTDLNITFDDILNSIEDIKNYIENFKDDFISLKN
jgi:hypothetical protein